MKRIWSLVLLITFAISFIYLPVKASTQSDFTVENGVLTGYTGSGGDVVIPGDLGIETIGEKIFYDNKSINSVTIPDGVSAINAFAFESCSLAAVSIPDSVNFIGNSAFGGCGLKTVTVPKGVMKVGQQVFSGCPNLEKVVFADGFNQIGLAMFGDCHVLTEIVIPESVTFIGNSAFAYCMGLQSITIPKNVSSLDDGAFYGCTALKSVSILNDSIRLGSGVFRYSGLEKPLIVNNGTTLCFVPFSYTSYTIPDTVTSIAGETFREDTNLAEIKIPASVTVIGGGAFEQCTNLKSITLPESLTELGEAAFMNCDNLKSINIPKGLTTVGIMAFTQTGIDQPVFSYDKSVLYYVPWSFKAYTVPDSVERINGGAFWGCSLTSVTLPRGLTEIGDYAFYSCNNLTSISIPESVTSLGKLSFTNCYRLKAAILPKSLNSIDNSTFGGSANLTLYGTPGSGAESFASASKIPFYPTTRTAAQTGSAVNIDGKTVKFEAYNIDDSNYFKLRDVAAALSGTAKQFDVTYDVKSGAIKLTGGKAYTPVGGELSAGAGGDEAVANINLVPVYLNGVAYTLQAYSIGGYNYLKLRDLAAVMNLGVTYDAATDSIMINTATGYTT